MALKRQKIRSERRTSGTIWHDKRTGRSYNARQFEVLGVKILCSDSFGRVENINNGISLLIDFDVNNQDDSDRVQQFYDEIKDHDSLDIEMPLKEQFWGGKMGAFTDKYGVRWMLHGQDYTKLN